MNKFSIPEAIRIMGHLLEHHGISGPVAVDKNGAHTVPQDPQATGWCMFGVALLLDRKHGVDYTYLVEMVGRCLGKTCSLAGMWEYTTPEERLAMARKLQAYNV